MALGDFRAPVDAGTWYACNKEITYAAGTTGAASAKTIFTVTGLVRVRIFAHCTADLTSGGAATIQVGTAITAAGLIASTTATTIDAGEIWHDATADASVELETVSATKLVGQNIIETIGTTTVTGGTIKYTVLWQPVSDNGLVVAA